MTKIATFLLSYDNRLCQLPYHVLLKGLLPTTIHKPRWGMRRSVLALTIGTVLMGLGACATRAPTHFYTLSFEPKLSDCEITQQGTPKHIARRPFRWKIELAPIEVPAQVARPQIVLTRAPGEVVLKERARWAASLQDEIHMALFQALHAAQNQPVCVSTEINVQEAQDRFSAAQARQAVYRLTIKIARFSSALSQPGHAPGYASMRAIWQLSGSIPAVAQEGSARRQNAISPLKNGEVLSDASVPSTSESYYRIQGDNDFTQTFTQPGYTAMVLAHQQLIARLASEILSVIDGNHYAQPLT